MTSLSAYVRVSMDKTGAGLGVANQRDAITKWAETHKHEITNWYEDNDISATSGKRRPAFEQMLADAPPEIVVWHQDRLLRVSKDLEKILDKKMVVHQVTSGSLDLASPAGRAVARTIAAWSTYEGEQKGERMKLRNTADAEQGKTFLRREVFGNNLDGTLKQDEAQAIRTAVKDLLDGNATMGMIAKRWNAAEMFTPYSRSAKAVELDLPGRGGNPWNTQTIKQLLSAERLKGSRTYRGKTVQLADWTPILDPEQWADLQAHLDTTRTGKKGVKKNPAVSQLLTGILQCPDEKCHKTLTTTYASTGARQYRCGAGHGLKTAEPLERVVIRRVLLAISAPSAQKQMFGESGDSMGRLRAQRLELVAEHEAYMQEAVGVLKPLRIAQAETKHEETLRALDAQILELDKDTLFEGLRYTFDPDSVLSALRAIDTYIEDGLKMWEKVPLPRRRKIVEALFDKITFVRGARGHRFRDSDVLMTPSALLEGLEAYEG